MNSLQLSLIVVATFLFGWPQASVDAQKVPQVLDDRYQITLFASEPDIVTPTGATFDNKGRLLVIESHTHQRLKDYQGPVSDRIRIVEDTDNDGKADRFSTFFEGTEHTMSIRAGDDGWVYVATRAKIFRIRDSDDNNVADQNQLLVELETKGKYPHNGLAGLAFTKDGNLAFGMGENLGVAYRMVGADGLAQSGSGEGGIFQCSLQGQQLTRLSTGFWNPFGICVGPHGRMFAVGNDADSRPPSRLVQIVETADFGFQYKYGRTGVHPLQAWDGELPGTLPMVSGTGEAPCELVYFDGQLMTGAWGDYRIERYQLVPVGASFQAKRSVIVQGDDSFRPVAFAEAADQSMYITDWVDKSYPVHGKGRIWRLQKKSQVSDADWPKFSGLEEQAIAASATVDWGLLGSEDRFARQYAVAGLAKSDELNAIEFSKLQSPLQKLTFLQALRWKTDHSTADGLPVPLDILRQGLNDQDPAVRLLATRWIADLRVQELLPDLRDQLRRANGMTAPLFSATLAAIEYVETGKSTFSIKNSSAALLAVLQDESSTPEMIQMALQMVPVDQIGNVLPVDSVVTLASHADQRVQREAVRALVLAKQVDTEQLQKFTADQFSESIRQDAEFGITNRTGSIKKQTILQQRPQKTDVDAWSDLINDLDGDVDRGWRVFHGAASQLACARCHQYQGRGAKVGPDLTKIVSRTSQRDVLQSMLNPSADVAPHFVTVQIETESGKVISGQSLGYDSQGKLELIMQSDGQMVEVEPAEIVDRAISKKSVMPDDQLDSLTVQQIADLLAFLKSQ